MPKTTYNNSMETKNHGEIILYQSEDGLTTLEVKLQDDSVWLTQTQLVDLFQKTKQNISLHIRNIFREGELQEEAVVKEYLTTATDGKKYRTNYYNLDVIISIGYRVKSQRGTQFRIWATSVLKDYLVRGYSLNQKRLEEKGTDELTQAIDLLVSTLKSHDRLSEEGQAVLNIIKRYARTWQLLLQYDENELQVPAEKHKTRIDLDLDSARKAATILKKELLARNEATEIFGHERGHGLAGIVGAVQQTFGGQDLYPSAEEKAAHLLYFIIKDHPFTDGNKRIGTFLFVLFLQSNGLMVNERSFDNRALVSLALLTAASEPGQKKLMIRLIMNLLSTEKE